ncbi:MAG: hypothetical protein MUE78_02325 [Ilumatobacteraceae bacterium]|jgi:hypothetical protein|nr:hypothetical protein [Ilumatobacteraceae bacterium]
MARHRHRTLSPIFPAVAFRGRVFSPSYYVRRRALRGGRHRNIVWRAVALAIYGRGALRAVFGRHPEVVSIERLEPGQAVTITRLHQVRGRRAR